MEERLESEEMINEGQLGFVGEADGTVTVKAEAPEKEAKAQAFAEAEFLEKAQNVIAAVLFTLGGTVGAPELGKACGCDARTARKAARLLVKRYEEADGALLVREYDGSFQMCTNPRYYENLIRLVSAPKKPVLTEVVLETLSIIAFKNPATKVEIEKVRGVKSDHAVNKLIEYGLVEEVGRLDAPGRPALFAPTDEFYRRFGVSGKDDLPRIGPELKESFMEEVQIELKDVLTDGVEIETASSAAAADSAENEAKANASGTQTAEAAQESRGGRE